jgi:DNA-binding GntR family transcriptional regulator
MPHTDSAKPMYRKIRERLERDIAGGRYAAGE